VDVSGANEPRTVRKGREKVRGQVLSFDFIDVFADKYKGLISMAKPEIRERFLTKVDATSYRGITTPPSAAVIQFAESLGVDVRQLYLFLYTQCMKFREELYSIGAGSYQKTSGFDLEAENAAGLGQWSGYSVTKKKFSPDEERSDPEQGFREAQPEKYKRDLPVAGGYASIQSIIKAHTLDGALHRFLYYTLTGKITAPKVNILAMLGIDPEQEDFTGLPDFETWTL
jgi:hypothetical protein